MTLEDDTLEKLRRQPKRRWTEESVSGYSVNLSEDCVSDLEYDIDIDIKSTPVRGIWDAGTIWMDLMVIIKLKQRAHKNLLIKIGAARS